MKINLRKHHARYCGSHKCKCQYGSQIPKEKPLNRTMPKNVYCYASNLNKTTYIHKFLTIGSPPPLVKFYYISKLKQDS